MIEKDGTNLISIIFLIFGYFGKKVANNNNYLLIMNDQFKKRNYV